MAIVPDDELTDRNLGAIEQIKARNGRLVVIAHPAVPACEGLRITVPKNERELDPVLLIIPIQLMAYHAARALGRDIDKPRNLAKSVTVE